VASAAYSGDGQFLATCGGDGRVKVWNVGGTSPAVGE
jgi:WD40 repeat protein